MNGTCPICNANINLDSDLEASEIVACSECSADLEVESVNKENNTVSLLEAPEVEEDWGE